MSDTETPSSSVAMGSHSSISFESSSPESAELSSEEAKEQSCWKREYEVDSFFAWSTQVVGSFLLHFVGLGTVYGFGVYLEDMQEFFNADQGEVSLVGSLTAGLVVICTLITGRLADHLPFWLLILVGAHLFLFGSIVGGFSKEVWHLYLSYGIFVGVAGAIFLICGVTCLQQWFVARRGLATGFAVAGSGAGNLVIPFILRPLASTYKWQTAMQVWGGIGYVLIMICVLLVRKRVPKKTPKVPLRKLARSRLFVLLCSSFFFAGLGYFIPFAFLYTYAQSIGLNETTSTAVLASLGAASILGRIVLGLLADKIGSINILRASMFVLALISGLWTLANTAVGLFPVALFYGFFAGAFISNVGPSAAQYYPVEHLAGILGYFFSSAGIGNVLGPFCAGKLNEYTGEYVNATEFSSSAGSTKLSSQASSAELVLKEHYLAASLLATASLFVSGVILIFLPKPAKKPAAAEEEKIPEESEVESSDYESVVEEEGQSA